MDNEKKQVTYNSSITGETQVTFDIQQYMNNRASITVQSLEYRITIGLQRMFITISQRLIMLYYEPVTTG